MRRSDAATPATARHGEPASNFEQLGGELDQQNNLTHLRAQYLAEIFCLSAGTAITIAELAFGEVQS
ncbi:hypothetical protein ACVL91_009776 [Bradyrhizobium elkanii]